MTRRRHGRTSISLFPFLSILVCVIGTLSLLITGLAIGEINTSPAVDERPPVPTYVSLVAEQDVCKAEIDRLEALLAQGHAMAEKLKAAKQELSFWERIKEKVGHDEALVIELLEELDARRKELAKLESAIGEMQSKIDGLKRRSDELDNETREPDGKYKITQGGGSSGLLPAFVECTASGLILDVDRPSAERKIVLQDKIRESTVLTTYLEEVKAHDDWIVIFLIRPGGVKAFDLAYPVVNKAKPRFGYMPVPGSQPVDLTDFSVLKDQLKK